MWINKDGVQVNDKIIPRPVFTSVSLGCHIDGAFGQDHRRAALVELVRQAERKIDHPGELQTAKEIISELEIEPSDDYSEEDDAISFLQDHTEQGLVWELEAGDLILRKEDE